MCRVCVCVLRTYCTDRLDGYYAHIQSERSLPTWQAGWHSHHHGHECCSKQRRSLCAWTSACKVLFYIILWCLVHITSCLVFQSAWHSIAISGSTTLLPYFIGGGLVIRPWTFVVISGIVFTIKVTYWKNNGEYIFML